MILYDQIRFVMGLLFVLGVILEIASLKTARNYRFIAGMLICFSSAAAIGYPIDGKIHTEWFYVEYLLTQGAIFSGIYAVFHIFMVLLIRRFWPDLSDASIEYEIPQKVDDPLQDD